MVDLETIVTGAAAGAITGYVSGWVRKWRDDSTRRKAIATVLLVELRSLDAQLRRLFAQDQPASFTIEPLVGMFDAFKGDLVLFDSRAVIAVLLLRGRVRDLERQMAAAQAEGTEAAARRYDWNVQTQTALVLQQIPEVRVCLLRNGATPPLDQEPLITYDRPDLPKILPSPFTGN